MRTADRIEWVYLLLAVLGILVAGILTTFHFSERAAAAYCTGAGGCGSVQESAYSYVLGVPISLLGLVSYAIVAVLAVLAIRRWRHREWVPLAVFGLSLAGTLYSAYLTYLELYVLHAVCPWCVGSAFVSLGLLVASLADLLSLRRGPLGSTRPSRG